MRRALKVYFPDYLDEGAIFSKMPEAPWNLFSDTAFEMDCLYLASHSGIKPVTTFLKEFVDNGVLDQQRVADILWKMFGRNWKRLWDAYNKEYNPLDNYDVTETINRNEITDRTIGKDTSESGIVNTTDHIDSTNTVEQSIVSDSNDKTTTDYGKKVAVDSETDTFVFGFNSPEKVPTGVVNETSNEVQSGSDVTGSTSHQDTDTNSETKVDSDETINTTTSTTGKEDTTDNQKQNEEIIRHRGGNIGQNTYQELLRQEFELWKYNFYYQVFSDCDRVLCLSVFTGPVCKASLSNDKNSLVGSAIVGKSLVG